MTEDISAKSESSSLEESVFKTLSRQKRRDILRFIGERGQATFNEIKNSVGFGDSPSLSCHLNTLTPLVIQKEENFIKRQSLFSLLYGSSAT